MKLYSGKSDIMAYEEIRMTKSIEAKVVYRFSASAMNVFDAWLNADLVTLWMKDALRNMGLSGEIKQIEIDPRLGGRFLFSDMRDTGVAVHWGSFLIMDRPLNLAFTWFTNEEDEKENSSVVTLKIQLHRYGYTYNGRKIRRICLTN